MPCALLKQAGCVTGWQAPGFLGFEKVSYGVNIPIPRALALSRSDFLSAIAEQAYRTLRQACNSDPLVSRRGGRPRTINSMSPEPSASARLNYYLNRALPKDRGQLPQVDLRILARLVNQNGAVGQWRTLGIGLVFESRGVGQGEPRLGAPCISTLDIKIEVSRHSTSERKTEK